MFFFVLAMGALITVPIKTGALDRGSAGHQPVPKARAVANGGLLVIFCRRRDHLWDGRGNLGLYAIILPVIVGLGYDRLVGVGIIMVGAGVGTLASTVNPFATGVASDAAGIALGDGIGLRLIMYAVFTTIAVLYVLRYARRVKADRPGRWLPLSKGTRPWPATRLGRRSR